MANEEKTKSFEGRDKADATAQANKWINDHRKHGALHISTIVAVPRGAKWVATVTYREG